MGDLFEMNDEEILEEIIKVSEDREPYPFAHLPPGFSRLELTRRDLVRRGFYGAGLLMAPAILSPYAQAGIRVRHRETGNILNKIFGPGGKKAGQGVTIDAGMLLAVTGQGSFYGRVMSRGAKLAAKQIEAAGGPMFKITVGDHESGLVPAAVSTTRRMISQNRIKLLFTSYGAPSEAIVPLIEQNKLLSFNGGGASPGQLHKDFLWMTRMLFGEDPTPGGLAWIAKHFPKAKRLAVIGTLENAVEAQKKTAPRVWPKVSQGGKIVAAEIHNVGETNFSSVIARVKAAKADAILTESFGNDLGFMVKQFREAGVKAPIMGIDFTDQACKVAGRVFDTFLFANDFFDKRSLNPWTQFFVKTHRQELGVDPEFFGSNYYEMPFIVWTLMRRVIKDGGDPTSTEDLQKALVKNPTFPSVYGGGKGQVGTMTFDPSDHTISKPMGVFGVKNCQPSRIAVIRKVKPNEDPARALVSG